jgi:hypothetical protein
MKKQLSFLAILLAGTLAVGTANAQVHVHVGINESNYPGYTYYRYPTWRGHDHDRVYYQHYHHRFEREHRVYFREGRFDHERFEREHHWHH